MDLDELRQHLDAIDTQMVSLLAERAKLVLQVAAFKRHHCLPVHVPEREAAIIERLCTLNPGPLHSDAVARIYRIIIEEMRKFEGENVVP